MVFVVNCQRPKTMLEMIFPSNKAPVLYELNHWHENWTRTRTEGFPCKTVHFSKLSNKKLSASNPKKQRFILIPRCRTENRQISPSADEFRRASPNYITRTCSLKYEGGDYVLSGSVFLNPALFPMPHYKYDAEANTASVVQENPTGVPCQISPFPTDDVIEIASQL